MGSRFCIHLNTRLVQQIGVEKKMVTKDLRVSYIVEMDIHRTIESKTLGKPPC